MEKKKKMAKKSLAYINSYTLTQLDVSIMSVLTEAARLEKLLSVKTKYTDEIFWAITLRVQVARDLLYRSREAKIEGDLNSIYLDFKNNIQYNKESK
jgi:hypothetical protein